MTDVPVVVPDASVLIKWALESDDEHDRAGYLLFFAEGKGS